MEEASILQITLIILDCAMYIFQPSREPRQLMSVECQLADWDAALECVKGRADLDGSRLAIWGSSFGEGHAIKVASRHPELKAAISQCPFTDGPASVATMGPKAGLKIAPLVMRDFAAKLLGRPPVMVPIAANPGQLALMNSHDALSGYESLMPKGASFVNHVAARVVPEIATYRPGRAAAEVQCPILFCVSDTDTVTPPGPTLAFARRAPLGVINRYVAGHFDFYTGDAFEQLVGDQMLFLLSTWLSHAEFKKDIYLRLVVGWLEGNQVSLQPRPCENASPLTPI